MRAQGAEEARGARGITARAPLGARAASGAERGGGRTRPRREGREVGVCLALLCAALSTAPAAAPPRWLQVRGYFQP